MIKIRLVADITDKETREFLKEKWENMSLDDRKEVLKEKGFSDKFLTFAFEDLTPAIQSEIFIKKLYNPIY